MQGNILKTSINKGITAVFNFLTLLLTTQMLGAEVRGEIALLVLAITICGLFSQMVGGPALVYLSNEKDPTQMLLPSYLWTIFISILTVYLLVFFHLLPEKLFFEAIILSIIHGLGLFHGFILLGRQKIKNYNLLSLIQSLISFLVLAGAVSLGMKDVFSFTKALGAAYSVYLLLSLFFSLPFLPFNKSKINFGIFPSMFAYGLITQTANIAHLLSNRISFFVLEKFAGIALLGVFSAGVALGETMLIFSASASLIIYSKISAEGRTAENIKQTFQWAKISIWLTFIILCFTCILPKEFFIFLLGKSFSDVKIALIFLTPGLVVLSGSSLLSHYFSGTGRFRISTGASVISMFIAIILAVPCIYFLGMKGAAISVSAGMISSGVYLFHVFRKELNFSLTSFMIQKDDFNLIKQEFNSIINKKKA
jgi:O-antigen/teichoic acid export membrane protein